MSICFDYLSDKWYFAKQMRFSRLQILRLQSSGMWWCVVWYTETNFMKWPTVCISPKVGATISSKILTPIYHPTWCHTPNDCNHNALQKHFGKWNVKLKKKLVICIVISSWKTYVCTFMTNTLLNSFVICWQSSILHIESPCQNTAHHF